MFTRSVRHLPAAALGLALLMTPALAQDNNSGLQADVQHQLDKKEFRDIHAAVQGDTVTLTGTVKLLSQKLDAEKRVKKTHEVSTINNQIEVAVPENVSDQELFNKMGKQLAYNRQGYPSFPFNSITLQVQNGIAVLGGEVVDPVDKESAVGIVTNTPGVRGLVDKLLVAPVSPNDWQIRRAMFQALYGSSVGTKYAVDPGKPIRIVVLNGHVTLTGVVNSELDKTLLGTRAQGIPFVFSVNNDLQVAGQSSESSH